MESIQHHLHRHQPNAAVNRYALTKIRTLLTNGSRSTIIRTVF